MKLKVPPRWVRRLIIDPIFWVIASSVAIGISPLVIVLLAVFWSALPDMGPLRASEHAFVRGLGSVLSIVGKALRLTGFALVYLAIEVFGLAVAFLLWIASGFGYALSRPGFVEVHYRILKGCLGVLFWFGCHYFRLGFTRDGQALPGDDGDPTTTEYPLLVMSRHAGPGDSFLLVHEVLSWAGRRPRIVLKDTLQLDPFIDVYLNRLPMRFVDPTSTQQDETLAAIAELAATMRAEDALLIFPEGGNVTEARRARAIERLRESGRHEAAERAEAIQHLMPPRPSGVHAALISQPQFQVVVVAHTGLDHLDSLADIWAAIPLNKTLHLRWHSVPSSDVPHDRAGLSDWLFTEWEHMDAWVAQHQEGDEDGGSTPGAGSAPRSGDAGSSRSPEALP